MNRQIINLNCVGCGNCAGVYPNQIKMILTKDGFIRPEFVDDFQFENLKIICPIMYTGKEKIGTLWGEYISALCAYSTDPHIRECASSGGVVSSLLVWILETKKVDVVLETGVDFYEPLKNRYYLCKTKSEVLHCAGSRYAPAAPLEDILDIVSNNKKIAFVGKPCDVRAIRKLMAVNDTVRDRVKFVFSFLCAGTPSLNATISLAKKMGADSESIKSVSYRGNGWPGYATVVDQNGEHTMGYEESWGGVLGRNKQQFCRLCADGCGEEADISCGDCWYLDENGKPSFEEGKGRNIVFVRTDSGKQLFEEALKEKIVNVESYNVEKLRYVQPYQFERKTTLLAQLVALKIMRKYTPNYNIRGLIQLSCESSSSKLARIFLGTIKRIWNKKIL